MEKPTMKITSIPDAPTPEQITSIQVKVKTRDRIIGHGKMKETYDDVINRSLDLLEEEESE